MFHIIKGYATEHKNVDGSQRNTIPNSIHHQESNNQPKFHKSRVIFDTSVSK